MVSLRISRLVALFALTMAAIVLPQSSAFGQGGGGRARMTASIAGVKAVAKYEERGARRKFNFQLELATPGQTGVVSAVTANGSSVVMGRFTVDALRRGIVDIDTTEGDTVPDLNTGAVITLRIAGKTYTGVLSGR